MILNNSLLLSTLCAFAVASPLLKRDSCTLSGSSLSTLSTVKKCSSIVIKDLTVPAGTTLDLTGLASGTTVTFEGTTTFQYKEWAGPLISISGSKIKVVGASGNVIDGQGAKWWDGKGDSGKVKPKLIKLVLTGTSTVSGLNIKNAPHQVFSINKCSDLTVSNISVDIKAGDSAGGHNTDAFDVGSSTNVVIQGCTVYNQDDCIAVNSGTNIKFLNNYCYNGHGISIGSVGGRSDNTVNGFWAENNHVINSDNGLRIKTVQGATGAVKNVNFISNKISGIKNYGIVIEGDYLNGKTTGTATGGVPITNLVMKDTTGSVSSSAKRVKILVVNASSWQWSGVSITGGASYSGCSGIPSGSGASC
ncbi:pgu1p [Saccharomyces arboricola H-6]|uniref:endo-polygalacturonase n=1 Tax=Saccharomyces arboricola (strain H-6 / AS 2.3317 / CBS 10644) TaxID=1160507 RepID=J8Q052_SACAR|nr:pgu1p [Saccharomyces arboricola H-6]